jgi:hypothetical protein
MTREEQIKAAASFSNMISNDFIRGAEWADSHPNWHKTDEELPPPSIKVLVTDGNSIEYGWYDYYRNEWRGLMAKVTHWMYLPDLPQKKND